MCDVDERLGTHGVQVWRVCGGGVWSLGVFRGAEGLEGGWAVHASLGGGGAGHMT
jgi:hypothetical protein